MKSYLKIVLAGVNIICLLITLLYPNSATPYSLLPIIVTSCSWVFINSDGNSAGRTLFVISATTLGALCIFLGTTSQILPKVDDNTGKVIVGEYIVVFNDFVAVVAKEVINYLIPAIIGFVMTTFLILSDIISDYFPRKQNEVTVKNFDDLVNRLINK